MKATLDPVFDSKKANSRIVLRPTLMVTRLTTVPAPLAYQRPVQRLALAADPDLEEDQGEEGVITTTTTIAAPGVTTASFLISFTFFPHPTSACVRVHN